MTNDQHFNLILFGFKGAGKTYFGKLIAQELGRIFIDTDLLIEKLYEKRFQEKSDCRQIVFAVGEECFRDLENEVIDSLQEITNAIISLGGGAALNPENCSKLKRGGILVYLEVDKEILKNRIFSKGIPSFLEGSNPEKSFEEMYERRKPIYLNASSFIINLEQKTDRQVLDELIFLL